LFGNPATFTAAANTQASDYDKIMAQYDELAKSFSSNPLTAGTVGSNNVQTPGGVAPSSVNFQGVAAPKSVDYKSVTPQTSQYEQSGDVTSSLSKLSDLATTGGYSEADKQNIRERDISPIRSIYANAQQNAERSKALGGGYSPNFNAVTASMARDEANKIGDINTAANAGIAQNVASNRIAAASPYASASSTANAAQTAVDQHNADIINQINEANAQGAFQANTANAANAQQAGEFNTSTAAAIAEANANRATTTGEFNVQAALDAAKTNRAGALGAIEGKRSLYGTTPALTNTFGNQVIQAGQLGQGQQQLNTNKLARFGAFG
jgi:hypothetical protein